MRFIDEAKISVKAGDGGKGCVSFRRERGVPKGGPDGGNGGRGADVVIVAQQRLTSLLDLRYKRIYKAERGQHGMGKDCTGRDGYEMVIKVPMGTVIMDADTTELLADLIEDGQRFVCASAGRGGKGNAHFTTARRQAPRFAQDGEQGQERELKLELKLLADVGIIGFPNAGKSTLISRISAARPKIADYPFTTIVPNIGVVKYGEYETFVVADIPGLIQGAHSGKGLGVRFLKHVERTSLFIHMLDLGPDTGRDAMEDFNTINAELRAFNPMLGERLQVVALNKVDLSEAREHVSGLLKFFEDKGIKVFPLSAVTGEGVKELVGYVGEQVERMKGEGA